MLPNKYESYLENPGISKVKFCLLHIPFFMIQLILAILIFHGQDPANNAKMFMGELWYIWSLKFTRIYSTFKAIFTKNVYGYILSILVMIVNCVFFLTSFLLKKEISTASSSIFLHVSFFLSYFFEFILFILYVFLNRSVWAFINFKRTGPCLRNMQAYRLQAFAKCAYSISFILLCSDTLCQIAHCSTRHPVIFVIEFFLECISLILVVIDLKMNNRSIRRYTLPVLGCSLAYLSGSIIFMSSHFKKLLGHPYFLEHIFYQLIRIMIHVVLFYCMYYEKVLLATD